MASSDSDSENNGPNPAEQLNTPAWSVVNTPRPSLVSQAFPIASSHTHFDLRTAPVSYKRSIIDEGTMSMNRFLLTNVLTSRRRVEANPLLLQPWDRPSFINSAFSTIFKQPDVLVNMPVSTASSSSLIEQPSRPRITYASSILCRQTEPQSEDLLRRRALIRWRTIIESDVSTSLIGVQAEHEINNGAVNYNLSDILDDVFSRKSTATLIKRSGDLLKYNSWCVSCNIPCPWRLKEPVIYSYIRELKSNAAPSTAASFLSALRFSQHTIGLHAVDSVLSSRVKGASDSLLKNRNTVKQAKPLTASQVYKLEGAAINSPDDKIRYVAGYLCFCLYSCARFKDAMYAESWSLDMPSQEFGFIEARTKKHKTANITKLAMMLPLVGFARGLHTKSWGDVWFQLRDQLEHELDDGFSAPYVLPAILRNNMWASRQMTTSEGSIFLREILRNEGENVEGISTHSLKATLLSWASKDNMNIEDRRLLGHHVDKNQVSPLTYSRDALAGPLTRLWSVVCRVRNGQFDPDESRASRTLRSFQSNTAQGSEIPETDCTEIPPPVAPDFSLDAGETLISGDGPELELCSSDSDSNEGYESVSDLSDINDHECEDALLSPLRIVQANPETDPNLYIHKESGLGHILRDEEGLKFLCGKLLTQSYRKANTFSPSVSMCLRCKPHTE